MKKKQFIILACALLFGVVLSVTVSAADRPPHRGGGGPDLLSRYLMENQAVQVLSEITKQPAASIRQKLCKAHLPDVLKEYKIGPDSFHKAMRTHMTELVSGLEKEGYLAQGQGKDILAKMEAHDERHALMTRLIEKGIKDGTITKEEAKLLLPPPPPPCP